MSPTSLHPNRRPGIPAGPVADHLRALLAAVPGAATVDIARAARVSPKTVKAVLTPGGPMRGLRSGSHGKLMGLVPTDIRVPDSRVVNGHAVKARVASLLGDGWLLSEVAEAAGLTPSTLLVRNLDHVQVGTARRVAHAARLFHGRHPSSALVPEHVVMRQVEALMSQGWERSVIASVAGVSRSTLRHSQGGRKSRQVALRVDRVFQQLRFQVGPSAISMRHARLNGYAPWAAWEAGRMDVLDALPNADAVDDPAWRHAIRDRYGVAETPSAA